MTLKRACLDCGKLGRWAHRCPRCQAHVDRRKAARRPDLHNDRAERRRREQAVADHRAIVGDWCPGWAGRPAHATADLTADHVREVAAGGRMAGRLVVRCRSCNSAKAAAILARAQRALSPMQARPPTPRPSKFPTHSPAPDDDGPVIA
jgi:5-methylcytosine-specific restriction protein A